MRGGSTQMARRRRDTTPSGTAKSEPMKTGKTKPRREQNRTQWGGRPPKDWFPIDRGTPFQVLLKTRMTKLGEPGPPLSTHEVAARSGGLVSANTVSSLLRGKVASPSDQTIKALVKALEVDEARIRQAVAGSDGTVTMTLPAKARNLSPEAFAKLLDYLDFLIASERK